MEVDEMAALIRSGDYNDFTASAIVRPELRELHASLEGLRTLGELANATREAQPVGVGLKRSAHTRGLALKSLKLTEGFEGFLPNLFKGTTNEVYFVSWAWDLGGAPPFVHPQSGTAPDSAIIPMRVGKVREFIGAGVNLFPAQHVSGGLAVRIMIWESDADARRFGETLQKVTKEIKESKLTNLSLISTAASVPSATVNLVFQASLELSHVIGMVLKNNSDDYVDYYEGYYPVEQTWKAGDEKYSGHATEIVLQRIAG
jgi:hypothetical protein